MPRLKYTSVFKSKVVLKNAHVVFESEKVRKTAQRKEDGKEDGLEETNARMLKKIGQLTLERDFLQSCFRCAGEPVPAMPGYDPEG